MTDLMGAIATAYIPDGNDDDDDGVVLVALVGSTRDRTMDVSGET